MFFSHFEKKNAHGKHGKETRGFPLTPDSCGFITVHMNINGAIGGLIIMIMAMIIKMITMIIILITMAGQSGMLMKTSVGGSGPVARDPSV